MSRSCRKPGTRPPIWRSRSRYGSDEFWKGQSTYEGRPIYDRWSLVVQLSDRVEVEWFKAVPPISELGEHDIAISGIGTIAAARVRPRPAGRRRTGSSRSPCMRGTSSLTRRPARRGGVGAPDVSAHRILSDISAFIGHEDPSRHSILAAGDLNMIYGATGNTLALPERERAFWDRVAALGLEFLGPQAPHGWQPEAPQPDVSPDTKNVPTWVRSGRPPEEANRQFDYAIASRGFHETGDGARPQPRGRMGPERPLPADDRG